MPKQKVVVLFDMPYDDANYLQHFAQDAKTQIDNIIQRIQKTIELTKQQHPDALLHIAWREYGIGSKGSRYISDADRRYLKDELKKVIQQNENVTVFAGTTATIKPIPSDKIAMELGKILQYFHSDYFLQYYLHSDPYIQEEYNKVIGDLTAGSHTQFNTLQQQCRNVCDIASALYTARIDKKFLFKETNGLTSTVYKPFNKKGDSHMYTFMDRSTGFGEFYGVGVEICREHVVGVLLSQMKLEGSPPPLIQFILSAHVNNQIEHFCGDYVIQADDQYKPQLIATNERALYSNEVILYSIPGYGNMENLSLGMPYPAVIPDELKILNRIDELITNLSYQNSYKEAVDQTTFAFMGSLRFQFLTAVREGDDIKLKKVATDAVNNDIYKALAKRYAESNHDEAKNQLFLALERILWSINNATCSVNGDKRKFPSPQSDLKVEHEALTPLPSAPPFDNEETEIEIIQNKKQIAPSPLQDMMKPRQMEQNFFYNPTQKILDFAQAKAEEIMRVNSTYCAVDRAYSNVTLYAMTNNSEYMNQSNNNAKSSFGDEQIDLVVQALVHINSHAKKTLSDYLFSQYSKGLEADDNQISNIEMTSMLNIKKTINRLKEISGLPEIIEKELSEIERLIDRKLSSPQSGLKVEHEALSPLPSAPPFDDEEDEIKHIPGKKQIAPSPLQETMIPRQTKQSLFYNHAHNPTQTIFASAQAKAEEIMRVNSTYGAVDRAYSNVTLYAMTNNSEYMNQSNNNAKSSFGDEQIDLVVQALVHVNSHAKKTLSDYLFSQYSKGLEADDNQISTIEMTSMLNIKKTINRLKEISGLPEIIEKELSEIERLINNSTHFKPK